MHEVLRMTTERAGVFNTPRMRTIRVFCVLLLMLLVLLPAPWCCSGGCRGQPSLQQSILTSTLKVQTRKGCLLGLLVCCRGISDLGSFLCTGLACWPCISSLGRKPPNAAVLQLLRDR